MVTGSFSFRDPRLSVFSLPLRWGRGRGKNSAWLLALHTPTPTLPRRGGGRKKAVFAKTYPRKGGGWGCRPVACPGRASPPHPHLPPPGGKGSKAQGGEGKIET